MSRIVYAGSRGRFIEHLHSELSKASSELERLRSEETYWTYVASVWEALEQNAKQGDALAYLHACRIKIMETESEIPRLQSALDYANADTAGS